MIENSTALSSDARKLLCRRGWLSPQDVEFQQRVLDSCRTFQIKAGQTLFGIGDDTVFLHGLISGYQDLMIAPHSGPPVTVYLMSPGDWAGAMMLASKTSRRGTVIARTDCQFAYLGERALSRLEVDFPDLKARTSSLAAGFADLMIEIVAAQAEKDVAYRVKLTLLRLLGECFIPGCEYPGDPVELPVAQKDIAEMAFLTRNAVGPVLKQLERVGAISIGYRKTTVLNRALLRQ